MERATPTALTGVIKERESDQFARFLIEVEPEDPHRIVRFPINAMLRHKLLNAEYTDRLVTGKVDAGPGGRYAYGFEDARKDGAGAVGHGGGAPGMNGDLRIYPRSGYIVAVLSNLDPPAAARVSSFLDLRLPT